MKPITLLSCAALTTVFSWLIACGDDGSEVGSADGDSDSDTDVDQPCDPDTEVAQPDSPLCWLHCSVGKEWDGESCTGTATQVDFAGTAVSCPDGYRLPTRQEFMDLLGACDDAVLAGDAGYCSSCQNSESCDGMFGGAIETWYWSSSEGGAGAWRANLFYGNVDTSALLVQNFVRCLR